METPMIPCIIDGQYCELTVLPEGAVEVPRRPSSDHDWGGAAWVENLGGAQAAAQAAIDAAAGAARARYITTSIGQESTYLLKAADADRYKAAGYPAAQIASYPWVLAKARAASASPAAADYQAAADLIIATRDAWVATGAAIEEARERGKAAVAAAVDVAGVATARAAAEAELAAL